MTVNVPPGVDVLQPHEITILDKVYHSFRISVVGWLLVPLLDQEHVVLVLVSVGSHLLLLGSETLRIQVEVRVKIGSSSSVILQTHLSSISYISWHGGIVESVTLQRRLKQ